MPESERAKKQRKRDKHKILMHQASYHITLSLCALKSLFVVPVLHVIIILEFFVELMTRNSTYSLAMNIFVESLSKAKEDYRIRDEAIYRMLLEVSQGNGSSHCPWPTALVKVVRPVPFTQPSFLQYECIPVLLHLEYE